MKNNIDDEFEQLEQDQADLEIKLKTSKAITKKPVEVKLQSKMIARTFDDVTPEDHKEIAIKVLKHWLKNYYKLDGIAFPQSSIIRQEDLVSGSLYSGDAFCMKMDIEDAINTLPLRLKKIIYLHYIIGFPVGKICLMLGFKFRVDLYRRLEECFMSMYEFLGPQWLRTQGEK